MVAILRPCAEVPEPVENMWKARNGEGLEGFPGGRCGKVCSTWNIKSYAFASQTDPKIVQMFHVEHSTPYGVEQDAGIGFGKRNRSLRNESRRKFLHTGGQ